VGTVPCRFVNIVMIVAASTAFRTVLYILGTVPGSLAILVRASGSSHYKSVLFVRWLFQIHIASFTPN
jgi:hypothetical protein